MGSQYTAARLASGYLALWDGMEVKSVTAAKNAAYRVLRGKAIYQKVEARTGVPWVVVGLTHYRESNCNFARWLHNGDPMRNAAGKPVRTVQVTANRPPNPNVDWVEGAVDCLVACEHLNEIHDWQIYHVAFSAEKINGFGYRRPSINIPSPYLWGGTNRQKRGKFIRDRVFDRKEWDTQLGVMAVLKTIMDLDPDAHFRNAAPEPAAEVAAPVVAPLPADVDSEIPFSHIADDDAAEERLSPKAHDAYEQDAGLVKHKSKTIWGGLVSWIVGVWATFASTFERMMDSWQGVAFFAIVVIALSVGLYLVVKGRLDVQKLVQHLSPDGDEDEQ